MIMNEIKINLNDFRKFNIEDKKILFPILKKFNPKLSDYSFTNLFIWSEQYGLSWINLDQKLLFYDSQRDYCTMVIGMCNKIDISIYLKISDEMIRQGKSGNFYLIDLEIVDSCKEDFLKYFELIIDESFSDYVYDTKKLVELKGAKLAKKKNLISQF
ncbi:MAG: hypothetical protein HQK51_04295, partial [Oligoflexia bacterium]|nr:hypothetical protein [Oligoflexia bacterium]